MYVQESIYDKFLDVLVEKVKQQVIGNGFEEQSAGGPVVSHLVSINSSHDGEPPGFENAIRQGMGLHRIR